MFDDTKTRKNIKNVKKHRNNTKITKTQIRTKEQKSNSFKRVRALIEGRGFFIKTLITFLILITSLIKSTTMMLKYIFEKKNIKNTKKHKNHKNTKPKKQRSQKSSFKRVRALTDGRQFFFFLNTNHFFDSNHFTDVDHETVVEIYLKKGHKPLCFH